MYKLRVLSLFSGIGAFEKALTNLNIPYELVGFSEIDKYAIKSYCAIHNVSEDKNLGDVKYINEKELPDFDLMTFGFPCQDISIAGKGLGMKKGTRSNLYNEGMRILKSKIPKYSIIENVKNLTGKKFKDEFKQILQDLSDLGYSNYWQVLNAKDYGIPQSRERVFIISILGNHTMFQFPEPFELKLRLKDMLEDTVDEKHYISDEKVIDLVNELKYKKETNTSKTIKVGNVHPSKTGMNGNVYSSEGLAPTITTNKGEGSKILINTQSCICIGRLDCIKGHDILKRVYSIEGLSPTIPTCCGGNQHPKIIQNDYRIRKLVPLECFRLMGFSDTDFQRCIDIGTSNTQLYKQAGNSIVVNILEEIFIKLKYFNKYYNYN